MFKSPCKDCQKRHEKCHSDCQEYLTRKREYEDQKQRALDQSRQERENHYRLLREMKRRDKKRK